VTIVVQVALVASVFIAITTVVGVSWANAKNSQRSQLEDYYEKENKLLGTSLDRAERRVAQLEKDLTSALERAAILETTVSGSEEVRKLALQMAVIHQEQMDEEARRHQEHEAQMMLIKDLIAVSRQSRGKIG
jgi:hypothetical protein